MNIENYELIILVQVSRPAYCFYLIQIFTWIYPFFMVNTSIDSICCLSHRLPFDLRSEREPRPENETDIHRQQLYCPGHGLNNFV